MHTLVVNIARRIYRRTPWAPVRALYYNAFSRVVRNRRTRAIIDGLTFDLDLGQAIDLALYLREFEPEVTRALQRYTKPGMSVLDIGANIGAHTLPLAAHVGSAGRVAAFEPTDFAFRKLANNVKLNHLPHVSVAQLALSDHRASNQRIDYRSSWRTDGREEQLVSHVDFVPLDEWCTDNAFDSVDLIKMDVDGNEYPVLAGGVDSLRRNRPVIIMEAVGPHFADPARNPFLFLEGLGYSFADLSEDAAPIHLSDIESKLPKNDWGMTVSTNLVALPARGAARR